jgi:PAS domain S-box-containing protein
MLGYAPEELLGKSSSEFFYDQEQLVTVQTSRDHLKMGETIQKDMKFRCKDGSKLYTLYNATPLFDSDGIHIGNLAMHSDITERKNAEEALKKSEEKLKQALESGNIGIWDWDRKMNSIFLDNRAEQMFGLDPETFGKTYKFEDFINEEDIPILKRSLRDSLDNDLPFETIFRVKSKTGTLRYISSKGHIVKDNEGKVLKLSGICSDITDLKEGSEKLISKINEELLRSNIELENFAYVASHDLQEPLRMVSSFTQLLEMKYKDKLDNEALEYIHFAIDGSKRMYDLINGLLAYSRIHTKGKEFDRVDLNIVMENAIKFLTLKIQERNAIIKSDALPIVKGDYSQLIQLFQNLITNGIKFNNKKIPRINISVKSENDHYLISFKDNGIGIDPQYFDRIFRMFQRLLPKDQYEGTGIGLAICKRIVERHGGNIWVESESGKGSTFYFTIAGKNL